MLSLYSSPYTICTWGYIPKVGCASPSALSHRQLPHFFRTSSSLFMFANKVVTRETVTRHFKHLFTPDSISFGEVVASVEVEPPSRGDAFDGRLLPLPTKAHFHFCPTPQLPPPHLLHNSRHNLHPKPLSSPRYLQTEAATFQRLKRYD